MKRGKMRRFLSALLCAFLALGSLTFTVGAGADEYEELRYGMENDAVRAMQTRLNQLGYTVSPSGGYYDNTKNAVAAFQQAMGFAINGKVASPDVQAALFSSDAPTASGGVWQPASATPEPTSVPATATSATLSYGMTNSDAVLMMQKRLNTLGFMKGTSGNYWKETQKAMAAFLQAAGISGDGSVATPEMLQMLYSADAPTAYTTTTPPANNNAGGSSEATPTPPPANDAPITMLTYGMENNASVKRMQTRLRELGFFNSNPTGNYYGVTESAVEAFQKAAGLYVDGKRASVEMQDLLYSGSAPSAYSSMATYSELRLNMMNNDQVRLMQRRLAALGYFNVQYVTGNYMTLTSRAVADFQSAAGLPVNGNVATTATLEALYANSAPSKGSSATNPTPADATPTPAPAALYSDLVFGAQGSAVKTMQKRLKELGYLNDTADGIYGKNTAAAVSAFQVNAKLPQNGNYASAEMQQALYAGTAPRVDGTVATTPPAGATPTPTPAPTAIAYTDLTYGMVNNSLVKAMQDKLRELGYFSETSTGNYYTQTRRAVTAYEKARGVTSDGRSVSAALLQTILGASAATATPTPAPTSTSG
ncbi:MAG: peptidoglycan-binding protein, partial [Clostridia bacterium]|nr:peptidoglycan-binding protein [Clostridia bacterium]